MKRLAMCVVAAAIVSACTPRAEGPMGPAAAMIDPDNPLFAPGYMATAASGDQFEIQSSQLALQMSQNTTVRGFAQMLINDHSRMSQQMAATAQSVRLRAPTPMLMPQHQAMLDQLRASGSGLFDTAFQAAQVNAHHQALALHQNYKASGDVPVLRTLAAGAVPLIQGHLNHAQMLDVAPPTVPPPQPPVYSPQRAGERG